MEPDYQKLALLFPTIAAQLRGALSSLHLAAAQLAPSSQRERYPTLDTKAALLDQSYYQLLRLINNLTAAASLFTEEHPALRDCDIVELVGQVCSQAESLAGFVGLDFQFRCQLSRHICAVDPSGLEQLLFQLLSNAFKFTPSGGQSCGAPATVSCCRSPTTVGALSPARCPSFSTGISIPNSWILPPTAWGWACPCASGSLRGWADA